jgi:hypothetical protein
VRLDLPYPSEGPAAAGRVERVAAALDLLTERHDLKTLKGSLHWHLRHASKNGTLEITLWPIREEFWIEVRKGRTGAADGLADWLVEAVAALEHEFSTPSK